MDAETQESTVAPFTHHNRGRTTVLAVLFYKKDSIMLNYFKVSAQVFLIMTQPSKVKVKQNNSALNQ